MVQQAQAMQGKVQAELEALRLEGTSGGGLVSIEMTGAKEILSVRIDPTAVDPADVEMLQDLVLAAVNEAGRKVDEAIQEKVGGLTGGMKLPGM
jgi:DNA-binding YbaB/EbfC family protein